MDDNCKCHLHTFCKRLPKVELHAHLNGSIRQETLVELARERNVTLPAIVLAGAAPRDPGGEARFLNTKPRSLRQCFDIFACLPDCVNDLVALRRIAREALEDAARDGVMYAELRTGPKALLRDHRAADARRCTKRQYVETVTGIMRDFEQEDRRRCRRCGEKAAGDEPARHPLTPRLIISVDRAGTLDQALENVALAIGMFRSGQGTVVGVELGGNPTRNDFCTFEPAFEMARKAGLPISIHCGEVPMGVDELEEEPALRRAYREAAAVLRFRPERLGHALLLSDGLMEQLARRPIPIECCPTSNVLTLELATRHAGNLVDGVRGHPQLGRWLADGYPISVNTDDAGLFCTTLTTELLLVAEAFGLGAAELGRLTANGIDHAFEPSDETKKRLRTALQEWMEQITNEAKR